MRYTHSESGENPDPIYTRLASILPRTFIPLKYWLYKGRAPVSTPYWNTFQPPIADEKSKHVPRPVFAPISSGADDKITFRRDQVPVSQPVAGSLRPIIFLTAMPEKLHEIASRAPKERPLTLKPTFSEPYHLPGDTQRRQQPLGRSSCLASLKSVGHGYTSPSLSWAMKIPRLSNFQLHCNPYCQFLFELARPCDPNVWCSHSWDYRSYVK